MKMSTASRAFKRLLPTLVLFVASALPAHADSFTIDSTNCSAPGDCYDLLGRGANQGDRFTSWASKVGLDLRLVGRDCSRFALTWKLPKKVQD